MLFLNEFITSHFRVETPTMTTPKSNMLDLLRKYLNVMNDEGPDGLKAIMTSDFKLKIAPKSLGLPPPSGLDAYIELLKGTQKAMGTTSLKLFLAQGFEPYVISKQNLTLLFPSHLPDFLFVLL